MAGINFYPVFLDDHFRGQYAEVNRRLQPQFDTILARHISVLPRPLQDASSLPLVVAALMARGYSDSDVRKILGENFLRLL